MLTVIEFICNRWCNCQLNILVRHKLIRSGNDSGNSVMQKTLWCETVYIAYRHPARGFKRTYLA